MKKQEVIKCISDRFEWFETMQKCLGHYSWWYTNRSSKDCIDVKIHAWADIEEIKKLLTPEELKVINLMSFDLDEFVNNYVWDEFGLIEQARESLREELTEKYRVKDLEYGGRSGGWLCVVYDWETIYDDFDKQDANGTLYTYQELLKFKKITEEAEEDVQNVNNLVETRKKELIKEIEDPQTYIEELKYRIEEHATEKKEEAQRILAIL